MKSCPKCGQPMVQGSPHDERIKIQYECWKCGTYDCEYYTDVEFVRIQAIQEGHP